MSNTVKKTHIPRLKRAGKVQEVRQSIHLVGVLISSSGHLYQTHVFSFSFVVSVINNNLISVLSLSVYLT